MDLKLTGKLAFISGSTAGIGHAIATALAHEGARVIVNGREQASVDEAVARISAGPGGEVIGFAGDMSTAAAASALVARFPDIEILVNNLGIFRTEAFRGDPGRRLAAIL
jgi:NAD(P)-dependent dehydrogenase (short-subunit alcohol dehydrogenase family)